MTGQRIGDMNGRWAQLLKIHLAVVPPIVAAMLTLMVWLVSQQFADIAFRTSGERFNKADGYALEERARDRERIQSDAMLSKIDGLSVRIMQLERTTDRLVLLLEKEHGP